MSSLESLPFSKTDRTGRSSQLALKAAPGEMSLFSSSTKSDALINSFPAHRSKRAHELQYFPNWPDLPAHKLRSEPALDECRQVDRLTICRGRNRAGLIGARKFNAAPAPIRDS